MIKTVIFDLGKVLVDFDLNRAWNGFARFTDVPASQMEGIVYETSDKEVLKYGTSKKTDTLARYNTNVISDEEFYKWMCERLKLKNMSFDEFARAWGDIFTENKPVCGLAQRLDSRGYQLVSLSDTNPIQMKQIMNIIPATMRLFKGRIVTSYKVGSMKPNEKNYLEAIAVANAQSDECVYVDDRLKYVKPAIILGMRGVHYDWDNEDKRDELLINDLRKLGVRC
ncbi:HAD family phosphatase [Candidatus Woesearchaeota archaeon]|nr:HAD family phosphatase [Candidatus Woesearchaeota archaeon]